MERHPCGHCERPIPPRYRFCQRCNENARRWRLNLEALFPPKPAAPAQRDYMQLCHCGPCDCFFKSDATKDCHCPKCGMRVAIGRTVSLPGWRG